MGKIPKGWLNCPRKSLLILDKFVAFKTPLDTRYCNALPETAYFTPGNFFEWMSILKLRVGLWIDLTNTDRYYSSNEVTNEGVAYEKLKLQGHGIPPDGRSIKLFMNICDKFLSRSKGRVIAVHCTHGFNRTGYLIVSYLVERCGFSVEDALAEFATCRPPGIYRQMYITDLIKKYHPGATAPLVREPSWVNDLVKELPNGTERPVNCELVVRNEEDRMERKRERKDSKVEKERKEKKREQKKRNPEKKAEKENSNKPTEPLKPQPEKEKVTEKVQNSPQKRPSRDTPERNVVNSTASKSGRPKRLSKSKSKTPQPSSAKTSETGATKAPPTGC